MKLEWYPDEGYSLIDLPVEIIELRQQKRGPARSNGANHALGAFGSREEILEWLGHLARVGMTKEEYFATLLAARDSGRIIDLDESRPWTDEDLQVLANEAAKWEQAEDLIKPVEIRFIRKKRTADTPFRYPGQSVSDLLKKDLPPVEYAIDEIMPVGLGVVSGPPKVGKSWLVLQAAIEIASGGELLGKPIGAPRPVLYYALEDSDRRIKARTEQLIGMRNVDLSLFAYETDLNGVFLENGLEEELCAWLDNNDGDGVVIIDVLSMIRPISKGRGSAYDEDYKMMKPLREIVSARPSATICVVTHDRKAGSDDWLTTVTGTRGITGASDWIWGIKRGRDKIEAVINVTGRDLIEQAIDATFTGAWLLSNAHMSGHSKEQNELLDALRTEGDLMTMELIHYLFPESVDDIDVYEGYRINTTKKLAKLLERGLVTKTPDPNHSGAGRPRAVWHAMSEAEIAAQFTEVRAAANAAMPSHVRVTKRKRMPVDESA